MQPTKADKDSVFQCTVEYSMLGGQIKQKKSNTITINLNCEWWWVGLASEVNRS